MFRPHQTHYLALFTELGIYVSAVCAILLMGWHVYGAWGSLSPVK